MNTLIIKLGASGDVVRTTSLLHILFGNVDWVTSDSNILLLNGNSKIRRLIPWSQINKLEGEKYDLIINLEDSYEAAHLLKKIKYDEIFGAFIDKNGKLTYTENSQEWFDMSLISRFGKEKADYLKYQNRRSYQEILFKGLGFSFNGERYIIPDSVKSDLVGEIAIAPEAGPVWPNKKWAYYKELEIELRNNGYHVNVLPIRNSIFEHIADVKNHLCLISGDTLPMHIALGSGIKCITLFTCTSPWEIYDYGIQQKIISPRLKEFFYKRDFDYRATTAISVKEVLNKIKEIISL